MPGYCVIPSCKNRGGFSFPKDEAVRAKWVAAIKRRNWTPSPYSIVCHTHFVETDFHFYEGNVTLDGVPRRYQTLKKGVVPSIFPWSKPKSEAAILRDRRQSRRDAEDADRQMKAVNDVIKSEYRGDHTQSQVQYMTYSVLHQSPRKPAYHQYVNDPDWVPSVNLHFDVEMGKRKTYKEKIKALEENTQKNKNLAAELVIAKRRQELREAGITPSSPLWKPGLLGAIKFKTMPREIKTPARYATEDAPSTSKPKRGRPPSSASKVKSTPSPSRSSAKKVIDSIIIGDDDSDVEILDTPPSRKRKSADDNDPDWGSGRKVSRSKRGSQDRRTRESTRTAATPPSPGVAAVAKQVAAAAKQVAAPKSKQNTSVKQTPSPKGLPKASPKITVKTSVVQNRPKTVITKLSHWETPAVNAIDLCMECKEEPLSPAQMKAMANEKAQYDKSQNLVKAAREGRLVFLPGGETKILDKPFSMVYTPQTPPAPVIPPPVLSPAPVPVSMMPKSLLIPGPMGRSNSPDLMIVAETPPRLTAQVMQLTPNINTVSRPATATTHTAPNAIKLVHGTCGLGIRLPPGWEPLPTAPAPVAKTPTPPKASTPKVQQVTPKAMTTARAKAQSEALAFLRQQMQQEAQAKAESETQKKKAKKIAQLEGDESGNWVPLDEYYYGKMEGNPTYSELKGEHRFKCWYCNKMLYNNVAAMMHIQGHIDSERQVNLDLSDLTQCKHCYKQFDTPFEMQTHIEKVHMNNTNVLLCRICEKDHDSRQGLTDHMRRCHNACEMPYICQLCKFRSSMYSDVVDHFKKKHNSSESMLCLYCLRVFHIRFVSQGWGQTSVYYNHLMKHQVKNSCKKCALCKLIFLNPADLKAHRKADHEANQKGVIGMNAKYTTPDQVMIKVTEKGPNMKAGGGVKSLNVPAVKKIMEHRLSFPSEVYKVKCIECKMLMGIPDHYKKFIQCSMCRFATSCSFAYSNHMMGFHSGQLTAAASHTPNEEKLENQLYCSCGFTSSYGNKLANHLVACSKSSCYKDPPPPSAGDEFGQELQDPRKKPDASLLDILGLVKKDSLPTSSGKSIRHESPPPEPVDMPDVEMSDRPARRPSLLKDSMKKSFKTILKDEKDLEPPQEIRRIDDKKSSTENRRDSSAETKMEDDSETKTKGEEDSKTEMKDDSKKEETDVGSQKKEGDAELAKEGEESKEDTKEDSKEGKEEINNEKKEADFDSKQDVKENAEVEKQDADIENKEDDDKSSNLNAEGKVEGTKEDEPKEENREIKDHEAEVKTEEKKDTMDVEDKKTEEEMEEDNGNEVAKDDTAESVRVPDVEKNLEDSKMKQTESDKSVDTYKETREKNDENVEKKGEEMVEESSGFASGSVSGKKTLGLGLDYGSSSENEDEEEKVNEGGEEKSEDIPEKTPAAAEASSDLAVSSKEMTTTVDEEAEGDQEEEKRESVGGLVDYNDEEEKEEDSNKGNEGEKNLAEKAEEVQGGTDNDDTSGQSVVAGMETQDNEEVEDKSTVDKKNVGEEEDREDMDKEEKMTGLEEEENFDDEELRYDTPVQDEVNDIKNIDENKEEERMDISEEKEDLSQSSSSSQKQQELKPDRQKGESVHKSTENTEESSESASTEALFSEPFAPRHDRPASRVLGKSVGDVWEESSNARDWRESFSSPGTIASSDDNLTTVPTVHDILTTAQPADDNNTSSSVEDNLMTAPPADIRLTEAAEKSSPSISQGSDGFSDLRTKEDQTQSSLNLISGYDDDDEAVDDGKGAEESPSDAKTSEMEQVKTQQSETGKNTAEVASVPSANDSREGEVPALSVSDDRDVMSSESADRQREPSVSSSSQSIDRDRGQSNTRDRSRSRSRDRQRDRRSRSRDRDRDRDRHRDRDRDRDRHRERRSRSRDRDRHRDRDRDRYYDRDRDRDRHRDRSRDRDRYRERDRSRERDRDRDRERDRDRDYRRYRDDRRYR